MNIIERNREWDVETDKKRICMDWAVIRFWGKEILKNTDERIRVIEETVFEKQMKNPDDIQHRYGGWP